MDRAGLGALLRLRVLGLPRQAVVRAGRELHRLLVPRDVLLETTFFGKGTGLDRHDVPNEVRDNDFTGADLLWASFVGGVDLRAQTWPDDGDVVILTDIEDRVAWARQQIGTWKRRDRRKQALWRLDRLTLREGPEQRDLFHHRGIIGQPQVDELHGELFALLEQAPV